MAVTGQIWKLENEPPGYTKYRQPIFEPADVARTIFLPPLFKFLLALLAGITYPAWGQPLLLATRFISKHP